MIRNKIQIAISCVVGVLLLGLGLWLKNPTPNKVPLTVIPNLDTTRYTEVILVNESDLDSVGVYVTLPAGCSILGKFNMDSTNFNPNDLPPN